MPSEPAAAVNRSSSDAPSVLQCPICGARQKPRLVCNQCGSPIAAELDCFAALGLARKLTIDLPALERIYHDLSRRIHPDRFADKPANVRRASLLATSLLTRSYRTLRDPVGRGLYWLELKGEKLAENNKSVPPELAEMVFEIQEQLAELRAHRNGASNALEATMRARRAELAKTWDDFHRELEQNFAQWDQIGEGAETKPLIGQLKAILSKIAYMRTLIRDVDREIEHTAAN